MALRGVDASFCRMNRMKMVHCDRDQAQSSGDRVIAASVTIMEGLRKPLPCKQAEYCGNWCFRAIQVVTTVQQPSTTLLETFKVSSRSPTSSSSSTAASCSHAGSRALWQYARSGCRRERGLHHRQHHEPHGLPRKHPAHNSLYFLFLGLGVDDASVLAALASRWFPCS